jgi:hypothetical protein
MPGAFAHITLVNHLKGRSEFLESVGVPTSALLALGKNLRFTELGALSPDYPYLCITGSGPKRWADLMHLERTGDLIKAGISRLAQVEIRHRPKVLAWLLGFVAHVGTDMTVHPVVERKVGPYAGNERAHRICEMHQDTHIYARMNMGYLGYTEHFDSGIKRCCAPEDPSRLDPDVAWLWNEMLRTVHPVEFRENPPEIDRWHQGFRSKLDLADDACLIPLARHVGAATGYTYPRPDEVDSQYITGLDTPAGTMSYDDVFDLAQERVARLWAAAARGALGLDDAYLDVFGDWNLDSGRDPTGSLVMWRNA